MLDALNSALSGMSANAKSITVNANNVANLNTTGFKAAAAAALADAPSAGMGGGGAVVSSIIPQMMQGGLMSTGNPWDLAIGGGGFFTLKDQSGAMLYSRDGGFNVDAQGFVVNSQGMKLQGITPQGAMADLNVSQAGAATGVSVDAQGFVNASFSDGRSQTLGQVALSGFNAPQNLNSVGHNLYTATPASGSAITGAPGTSGMGGIVSGSLEQSNVDLASEFVNMISSQRAFEANAKTVSAESEMTREVLNLKA